MYDAVVIGAGPNGLSAAIQLARHNLSVCVLEANIQIGGGTRTEELTLPNFHHDVCSAIHPMGLISPFFKSLPLQEYGVTWINPPIALAHPLDTAPAAFLKPSLEATIEAMETDGANYADLMNYFVHHGGNLMDEILKPLRVPNHPFLMARFGLFAMRSAASLAKSKFKTDRGRALFAGCAAHSVVDLNKIATASFGITLALVAHLAGWPIIHGGSQKIIQALANYFNKLGGEIKTGRRISSLKEIPACKVILMALTPRQVSALAADELPDRFRKKLIRFKYGPAVFKMDWALKQPIPWKDQTCLQAATVHLGGSFREIIQSEADAWNGKINKKPFVIVAQQSLFDSTRAPADKHTGWAYCHVPNGSNEDVSDIIESQIERFAPGFRDIILARHSYNAEQLQQHNENLIGGDIGGGANNFAQFLARPVLKWDPYATPNPRIFICSSSTPPGGGVHGMCGFYAANSALKKVFGYTQL
jgi:phytoene dehydrogenase-like protein